LAKAQAKTKIAYETLKKKEDWATWTGQIQELYNWKVKQYEEAHRAWTLVLQDAITAEKNAKAELQALGKNHKDFKWDEVELEEKDFPPKDPPLKEMPKDTFVQKLEAAATAAKEREKEQERTRRKKKATRSRIRDPGAIQQGRRELKGKQGRLEFTPTPKGNSFAALGDGLED